VRGRRHVQRAAGATRRARDAPAVPEAADPWRRARVGRRGRGKPAVGPGTAAGRGAGPADAGPHARYGEGGGVSAVRAVSVRGGPATAGAAAPKRSAGQKAPDLRVVRAPQHARTRASFVAMCMVLLVGSLLGALVLNTSMAQGE